MQMMDAFFQALSQLPQVEAVALGGSRAGAVYDAHSDYDIYLYCTGPVAEEARRALLSRYCSYVEYGNCFWELEDNGIFHDGVPFDLLYRSLPDFIEQIAAVVEGFQAHNGYTTCMWHNLRTCKILYDRNGALAAAKARFDVPYPPELKQAIIRRNLRLLRGFLPSYDGQLRKAVGQGDLVSMNHRAAAFLESYFDILFALNERTHPGEKRLLMLCRRDCPVLPERFEENVQALLTDLFTAPERTQANLSNILTALEAIL